MYRKIRILPITFLLALFIGTASAAEPINTLDRSGLWGYKESGVAVRGYDTVAYFTVGKPTEGKEQFETEWKGAKWRFASQQNLDLFKGDPEKYAPQYGGYCAYGVAVGNLVKIEVDLWDIVDDKLYLNYDKKLQGKWRKDISGYIGKADEKFERLLEEK
ncbi:MAG: YHS domain-containing (seleno)protein [Pseudomonadota bacterium]